MSAIERALSYLGLARPDEERSWRPPWLGIVGAVILVVVALQIGRTALDASGTWPVLWRTAVAVAVGIGAVDMAREVRQDVRQRRSG